MSQTKQNAIPARMLGFGFVVLLHIVIVYALASGLARTAVQVIAGPMETEIIDEIEESQEEPPPPPPDFEQPPPAFVDMPQIAIETAPQTTNAIQKVTNVKPTAPPPPPPPPVKKVPPQSDPKRPITQPDYPATSRRLGEEGAVVLRFLVQADGRVDDSSIEVTQSSGHDRLDKAAVQEAKRRWRFKPATEDGKPVAAWHQFRVVFQLTN
jgi:protein TonB